MRHTVWLLQKCSSPSLEYIQTAAENFVLCQLFVCAPPVHPPPHPPPPLLCQLCLRIWLWGLAYIEACRADSKLAERVANDCLAARYVWWQEVNHNSWKVTGTLPEENVWLVWFAPKPGPDKRCFCPRLNSSLEMWKGFIIHEAETGWHWTAGSAWRFRPSTRRARLHRQDDKLSTPRVLQSSPPRVMSLLLINIVTAGAEA